MPIYEYICDQCDAHSEAIQKFSDAPLTTCEACGGNLHRPISKTSFSLKGGGWYADGYSEGKSTKKESSTGGKSETKSATTQSDTKPETKSTTSKTTE